MKVKCNSDIYEDLGIKDGNIYTTYLSEWDRKGRTFRILNNTLNINEGMECYKEHFELIEDINIKKILELV